MVKSVIGEESRLQSFEERLSQSALRAQVGLLVGRLSAGLDRGFVYDLVPTPPTDSGSPPCSIADAGAGADRRKGSKGGGGGRSSQVEAAASPLSIDADWVAEHARQVSRMLLGGIHVVGIYVWASESSFKASNLVLWQTIKTVSQAAPFHDSDPQERLLVHASYSPRRWTCRNCILTSSNASSNLRPCDFKLGKLLASLQNFRCMYRFDIRLPIGEKANAGTFTDVLRDAITSHATELKSRAKALVDGKLVTESLQSSPESTIYAHEVELLLPFINRVHYEASSLEDVTGLVAFTGVIYSSAYLGPKDTILDAVSEIKGDIISTLLSRLDIMSDGGEELIDSTTNQGLEAVEDESANDDNCRHMLHKLKKRCTISFPRRVLVPWLADVFICDYLQTSETFEDLKDHCKEMMSMDTLMNAESIVEVEKEASSLMFKSFQDAVPEKPAPASDRSDNATADLKTVSTKPKSPSLMILIPIAVLLISVILGWAFTMK